VEDNTPFTPYLFNDAYKELVRLLNANSISKTISMRSKKWWDEEIDNQLRRVRRADTPDIYKSESKALKRLIRQKKKEC